MFVPQGFLATSRVYACPCQTRPSSQSWLIEPVLWCPPLPAVVRHPRPPSHSSTPRRAEARLPRQCAAWVWVGVLGEGGSRGALSPLRGSWSEKAPEIRARRNECQPHARVPHPTAWPLPRCRSARTPEAQTRSNLRNTQPEREAPRTPPPHCNDTTTSPRTPRVCGPLASLPEP